MSSPSMGSLEIAFVVYMSSMAASFYALLTFHSEIQKEFKYLFVLGKTLDRVMSLFALRSKEPELSNNRKRLTHFTRSRSVAG